MRYITSKLLIILFMSLCVNKLALSDEKLDGNLAAKHERGVQIARDGNPEKGLVVLAEILAVRPNSYPVRRDYIIILNWAGRCDEALAGYEKVKDYSEHEPYFIVSVSECMEDREDYQRAIDLLKHNLKKSPDDEEMVATLKRIEASLALVSRPAIEVTISTDKSELGSREWKAEVIYSDKVADDTRAFTRFLKVRAKDSNFATGDLNRIGIGVHYGYSHEILLKQEFSTDISESGETGSTTGLIYTPDSLREFGAEYATFSEDIPLRLDPNAKRNEAKRFTVNASYHTHNYQWEYAGSISRYSFSDDNDRTSIYAEGGYAFELKPEREQRVIVEISTSKNSDINTNYFNPKKGTALILAHKTNFVIDSKYDRRVDTLYLYVGNYSQRDFPSKKIYGARYQQAYDLDALSSLTFEVGMRSAVYDGIREQAASALMSYRKKL